MAEEKIAVYICHCGTNIAGKVDVEEVTRWASEQPNVAVAREYKYMCSDPGQDLIKQDIAEHGVTRAVVAACSPTMHEPTFRKAAGDGGLNPYLLQMANIREHCSWVTIDGDAATEKAKRILGAQIHRLPLNVPLEPIEVPVNPNVMVVGGGIAGIEAALKLAATGKKVYLVERDPSIGGHMAMFDKTFPTLDCAACILTPKMSAAGKEPNIEMLAYSEVTQVDGYVGNFKVKVRKKARYIDIDKCTGCALCTEACVVRKVPNEFDQGLSKRSAAYIPFPQAVPLRATIDPTRCLTLTGKKCKQPCVAACGPAAIDFDAEGRGDRGRGRGHHHGHRLPALGRDAGDALQLRQARQRHLEPRVRAYLERLRADRRPHRLQERRAAQVGRHPALRRAAATRTTRSSARACAACTRSSSRTSSRSTCPRPRCTSATSTCAPTARATRSSTSAS